MQNKTTSGVVAGLPKLHGMKIC